MAESAETRKLSGLARSIDALFAPAAVSRATAASGTVISAPAGGTTEIIEVSPAPNEAAPAETLFTPLAPPDVGAAPPAHPEMFPASQMLDAIKGDSWADSEPLPVSVEPTPVPWSAPGTPVVEIEPVAEAPMDLSLAPLTGADVSAAEVALPHAPVAVTPAAKARSQDELDLQAFPRAVGDFLAGEPDARERVESLAGRLRERLALDPLADAVETLVREAGDPPDARYLDLAGSVINPSVASRLVQRMGHESDEAARAEYLGLCRRLGRVMANALRGALTGAVDRDVRRVYHNALISMGEASRPVIEGMVADDNRFLVRDGVAMLGEIGGARAIELVTSALADTDARVRAEALLAVGKLGDADAGQLVLGFLDDPDSSVRVAAAVASGQLGLERALRPLLHMLESAQDPEVCIPLLRALGQIGDPGAVHAIEKHAVPSLFSKPRTDVRIAAYRALHAIGTPHARDLIKRTATDKDPVVRVALRDLSRAEPT
jgi:hypothetical protein